MKIANFPNTVEFQVFRADSNDLIHSTVFFPLLLFSLLNFRFDFRFVLSQQIIFNIFYSRILQHLIQQQIYIGRPNAIPIAIGYKLHVKKPRSFFLELINQSYHKPSAFGFFLAPYPPYCMWGRFRWDRIISRQNSIVYSDRFEIILFGSGLGSGFGSGDIEPKRSPLMFNAPEMAA